MNRHHTPSTSTFSALRSGGLALALAAVTVTLLSGCDNGGTTTTASSGTGDAPEVRAASAGRSGSAEPSASTPQPGTTRTTKAPKSRGSRSASPHSSTPPSHTGPKIVYFKVTRKPKCPEGTAVFRSENMPMTIKWKITGATAAALSVDAPKGQVGTYGSYGVEGSETFLFSCGGPVGSTETHTYTIYTVGGGAQRSKTLTVSAKILDDGTDS